MPKAKGLKSSGVDQKWVEEVETKREVGGQGGGCWFIEMVRWESKAF